MKNLAGLLLVLAMGYGAVPTHGVAEDNLELNIERNVEARMRDGVILRADVYRPTREGTYPVLLMRTPYGKATWGVNYKAVVEKMVAANYIVVMQDTRGRYESDGEYESLIRFKTHEPEDGYDTVEWAARLPGANGSVGTFGLSYMAFTQWRLAPLQPPSLKAIAAFSLQAKYTDLEGPGTIRPWRRLAMWNVTMAPEMRRRHNLPGPQNQQEAQRLWDLGEAREMMHFLPWMELPNRLFEHEGDTVRAWLKEPHLDPWKLDEGCPNITVPNLNMCGWYDHCAKGTIDMHHAMVQRAGSDVARKESRIIIGPWNHVTLGSRWVGAADFGPEAQLSLADVHIRWFDRWLKGKQDDFSDWPQVRAFVLGSNRWEEFDQWPPKPARAAEMFLTSSGSANTPGGDGKLVHAAPKSTGEDHYRYDPRDPVTSLFHGSAFTIPADQAPLQYRKDILVYQTLPLKESLQVTGYPEVELYAASTAPDTDFFAQLIDVAPDGSARNVCQGMVRARYRHALDKPELIKPGEVVRYRIKLDPVSAEFLPGHRLRLDITSSDFPNWDRNHNTAADQNTDATLVVADQTIHHGSDYLSKLILPVMASGKP